MHESGTEKCKRAANMIVTKMKATILETIIKYQDNVCGLAIEFHDCDLHLLKIKNFIEHFRLDLVHVHANNYAPINLDDGLPLVLELTFSEGPNLETTITLPHPLDMPNNPAKKEITLTF